MVAWMFRQSPIHLPPEHPQRIPTNLLTIFPESAIIRLGRIVTMIGLGTLINTGAIVAGGIAGAVCGRFLKPRIQETLNMASGISVMFIGISGAMSGMLSISEGVLSSANSMVVVICLALGALFGEILNIERWFELFGEWLKKKTGNANDNNFVNGFLTASLTVSIGAMAIVGSIQDGILGDYSILATKGLIDLIIIMVMTCSLGKGCVFSAIPVFVIQGSMTLLASLLKPIMTDLAMAYLSMVGSILIFCVGMNLVFGKKVRVANMLPAIVFCVIAAFI